MDKFIELTDYNDEGTLLVNSHYIVKAINYEDDEYTTIVMADGYDDLEVTESISRVKALLKYSDLGDFPAMKPEPKEEETPPPAGTDTFERGQVVTSEPNWLHHK